MRSSYETRVAVALDAMGIKWEYEPHRFDLNGGKYTPDFFLVEEGVYWEVKGWFHERARERVASFRAVYRHVPLVVFSRACLELLERSARQAA